MVRIKVDNEITLLLLQQSHAEELFWIVDQNREYLRRWLPWVDGTIASQQMDSVIRLWLGQFQNQQACHLGIYYENRLAGTISLHGIDWANAQASIGYFLAENKQGKGIIIRAVHALLNYAFHSLRLNRIEIRCGKKNFKSRAIPEKMGFYREGVIRDGEFVNNRYHDLIIYSLLAREWFQFRVSMRGILPL